MTDRLHLPQRYRRILEGLLREYVPEAEVWAFGSRITGKSHEGCDLDVVVRGPELKPLDHGFSELLEAIEQSNIPILVQAHDWARLPESLHAEIERDYVVVQEAGTKENTDGEWRVLPFNELLLEPVRNGIYKKKEFHGRGVKIVNMGELFAHPRLRNIQMKRVALTEQEKHRASVQQGDLLFARRSLVAEGAGKCCVVLETDEPTSFESSIIRARPDPTTADSLFLYYYFNSPHGLHGLDSIRRQVAVAGITGTDLAHLGILAPSISEQRKIAHILGTLDDKIELNRRMNETLEEMARALFKSWFVDFDPVRAKAALRTRPADGSRWTVERARAYLYGMDNSVADLFPERLVDSELGKIPEGWEVGNIGTVANQRRSGVNPDDMDPETPYIGLEHIPKRCIALSEWGSADGLASGKFRIEQGDILFGKLRPYFHKVGVAPLDGVCSTDIVVVSPISAHWFGFVLGHTSSKDFVDYADAASTGTRMPRTKWEDMALYKIALPSGKQASAFNSVIQPWINSMLSRILESRALDKHRDALLPRLVSGKLRVEGQIRYG